MKEKNASRKNFQILQKAVRQTNMKQNTLMPEWEKRIRIIINLMIILNKRKGVIMLQELLTTVN